MEEFSQLCSLVEKENSTLKKISIISEHIKKISTSEKENSDNEVYWTCVYLSGQIYPSSYDKNPNVGPALIRNAIIKLFNLSKEKWNDVYKKHREIGETVESIYIEFSSRLNNSDTIFLDNSNKEISISYFKSVCDNLSQNTKSRAKIALLENLFKNLTPLSAKYVARLLNQNLRIGVQEQTIEASISKAFNIPKTIISKANFYLGDIGQVAIRAKYNDFADIEFKLFHPIKAMLATAETNIDEIFERMGSNVWIEYKYDGIRAHVHKEDFKVKIYTRDLKDVSLQFPEIVEFFKNIHLQNPQLKKFLIDGEIVAYQQGKIMPFAYLQKRLGRKENIQQEVSSNPTFFIAYDLLVVNDQVLFDTELEIRRNKLLEYFKNTNILFSQQKIVQSSEEFISFFNQAKQEGREGLMIKNPKSKYEAGKRGLNWLKYKQTLDTLDVVILQAEYGEGRNAKLLSIFTFGVWDEKKEKILPIGRAYSGATEEDLEYLTKIIPQISTEVLENGYKVQPKIILEVGYENIQVSNRYTSGFALRFPRIIRIRDDKPLEEINTILDVKEIYRKIKGITTK